jgi:hypothetical protein
MGAPMRASKRATPGSLEVAGGAPARADLRGRRRTAGGLAFEAPRSPRGRYGQDVDALTCFSMAQLGTARYIPERTFDGDLACPGPAEPPHAPDRHA